MLRQWRDKTDEFEVEADSEDFKKTVQYAEDDFNRVVMMEDLVVWVVEDSKYIPIYSWIFEFPKFSWFSLLIGRTENSLFQENWSCIVSWAFF